MNKIYLILGAMICASCSYSTHYVSMDQAVYPPTSPTQVAISAQKLAGTTHKVLGRVAVVVWGDGEDARQELQREASRIGANAVIDLRLEKSIFRTAASGLAILLYRE